MRRWCRRFVTGAAAAGLGWGAAGLLFFVESSVPWQMFLALVLAGVAMAAVPVLAPVMTAFFAFTIPTLLPIIARFLLQGQPTGLGMAALGVLFGSGLGFSAWRIHQGLVRALVLAFENRDLVAELSVEVLAARANMSVRHFGRLFRRRLGSTPGQYVRRARLDAARRQIESTAELRLKAVARRCGFADEQQLRRAFRAGVGVTPAEYRARFAN